MENSEEEKSPGILKKFVVDPELDLELSAELNGIEEQYYNSVISTETNEKKRKKLKKEMDNIEYETRNLIDRKDN